MINDNTLNYNQYLGHIKKQVIYAKTIYETLSDAVRHIKDAPQLQQQQPQLNPINPLNPSIQHQQNVQ